MVITNPFNDKPAWRSAKQYFHENGSGSPDHRMPSPDKITTPTKLSLGKQE